MKYLILLSSLLLLINCGNKTSKDFPFFKQRTDAECGSACLKMIAQYKNKDIDINDINEKTKMDSISGTSLLNISDAASLYGLKNIGVKLDFTKLKKGAPLPCIVHWRGCHFIIVYKIEKNIVYVADPADTLIKYTRKEFCQNWYKDDKKGFALLFE